MKSKLLRALSVFMCVVVLAESVDCSLLADAQEQEFETEETTITVSDEDLASLVFFETERARITYELFTTWEEGHTSKITIENIGEASIENWSIRMQYENNIAQISNARIIKHAGNI